MTKHAATLALTQALLEPPGSLPEGHLAKINALQERRGKNALSEADVIVRPIRLTGSEITDYATRFPEAELLRMAGQINERGIPLLTAHVTNDTPIGRFYTAEVTPEGESRYLDTYAYWLADEQGNKLTRAIDAGIVEEASIGFYYERGICSIDGGDYYDCGHWPGETYTVVDPVTKQEHEEECFIWMLECEAVEGSITYAGAHPNTRVGGTFSARDSAPPLSGSDKEPIPSAFAPAPTYFQLAAAKDMDAVLRKAKPKSELGKPNPPVEPETEKEVSVETLKLKLPDGSVKELEANDVQGVLDAQLKLSGEGGEQRQKEAVAAALGIEPKDVTDAKLAELKAQAKAGEAYVKSLEGRLTAAALALGDDDKKAARIVRLAKGGTLQDLEETVEDYEARRDALVPDGQLSKRSDSDSKKHVPDYASV